MKAKKNNILYNGIYFYEKEVSEEKTKEILTNMKEIKAKENLFTHKNFLIKKVNEDSFDFFDSLL